MSANEFGQVKKLAQTKINVLRKNVWSSWKAWEDCTVGVIYDNPAQRTLYKNGGHD